MPPRRRGHQARPEAPPAIGAPAPGGVAPAGRIATAQTWWAWLWENKAASSTLVALAVLVVAALVLPSRAATVARALSSRTPFPMPTLARFVERREMALIVDAVEHGMDYVVVDGGNRVGKSVAVEVAASRLSGTHSVLWSVCNEGDTAAMVLRRLLGLDVEMSTTSLVFASLAKLQLSEPRSVAEIRSLVLSTSKSGSEPVFVVEMAERLEVKELKALLDFAKELTDLRRGRFIFVFSPTEKFDAIGEFGSLSRAKVIDVGDLSEAETTTFLTRSGCAKDQAVALYAFIGGHLPHLLSDTVFDYCRGTLSLAGVESTLFAKIGKHVENVDRILRSACDGLCGVMTKAWPEPEVLDVLLKEHLVIALLEGGVYVDSQVVRAFVNARCTCR